MIKFAYLTLFTENENGEYQYLIGQKKFLNLNDGYIGTNPNQYVIPGGNIMEDETPEVCGVREFEEETGYNLYDLGCNNIKQIYTNKYAKFFMAEIPYKSVNNFKYSKTKIVNKGHYPEFIKFKWVTYKEAIKYFKRKPKIDYLINLYLENKDKFIKKNNKPDYLSNELYLSLLNDNFDDIKKFLKKYISKRLDNDWFINMFNNIKN
jgi:8-oxo-dGTP pyrophosphatase MutT (NUDIX family)